MPDPAEELFARISERLAADPRVGGPDGEAGQRRRFGAAALKVDGKIFAMVTKGQLVFKLPRPRVDAFVESGAGQRLDTGNGRQMKEWLALDPERNPAADWHALADEALAFTANTAR